MQQRHKDLLWEIRDRTFGWAMLLVVFVAGCGVVFIVGYGLYTQGTQAYKAYVSSKGWQRGMATVQHTSVSANCGSFRYGTKHALDVTYRYEANGQTYTNDRIWFGGGLCGPEWQAQAKANEFPTGARMFVYYDPNDPADSVLHRSSMKNGVLPLLFWLLMAVAIGWGLCHLIHQARADTARHRASS